MITFLCLACALLGVAITCGVIVLIEIAERRADARRITDYDPSDSGV